MTQEPRVEILSTGDVLIRQTDVFGRVKEVYLLKREADALMMEILANRLR